MSRPSRAAALLLGLLLGLGSASLLAPGSLSVQALRLPTRNNSWSGVQTFTAQTGVTALLERTNNTASPCTDGFENRGGNLWFNCALVATSAGAGTVTSVGLTVPSILSVSGSPVTSSGT